MTRYTALVIKNEDNDIRCEPYGKHKESGKWAAAINLYHGGFFHTTLLSTDPAFESSEESVAYMNGVVQYVRSVDVLI